MQDIATYLDGLCLDSIKAEQPQNNIVKLDLEPWERFYIENIEGNKGEGGTTPENINLGEPIAERYKHIKIFRILGYPISARRERTKMFFELEDICRAHFFPLFFVLDFEEYQTGKCWRLNGEPIKNINGAFYQYARTRRERMKTKGTWRGHEMENYSYCGAWEIITK